AATLDGDEGLVRSSVEGLARLGPVLPGGTATFGAQTHPADGKAGIIVTPPERARELAPDAGIALRLRGFGQRRVALAHIPETTGPAALAALAQAGRGIEQMTAIKTHNPFALNDIVFARQTGADPMQMNNMGCSLVWGHPQAPM